MGGERKGVRISNLAEAKDYLDEELRQNRDRQVEEDRRRVDDLLP